MRRTLIYGSWELNLPDESTAIDWRTWEFARSMSMQSNLKRGDLLFDIGTEHGSLSALYATWVGGDNMILVEPTPEFWRNIRVTWEANGLAEPWAMVPMFAGATDLGWGVVNWSKWPDCSEGGEVPAQAYRSLADDNVPGIVTVDALTDAYGAPKAITIDVEGAEAAVLTGALKTLTEHHPLVWVSIHDELAERDFSVRPGDVRRAMRDLRYEERHLGTDHEQHWLFYDPSKPVVL